MSTVAPRPPAPPQPLSPALVDSEGYIDDHIRRTRRSLKLVDFAAGALTLVLGLLAFLLVAGLIDHWVIPGGLGTAGRLILFGVLVLGVAWFAWRRFVPLLRSINPVYAAHTIEQTSPSLKNSLLNVLMFRTHREGMSPRVYHALEQQAAQRLEAVPADAAIDHSALLRLGYALIAIIGACALYSVLSPKNLAVSAGRVLAPWTNVAAPSRVHILDIKPGDASVALGERVNISAEIHGAAEDDPVRLRYTTDDQSLVDESIVMTRPTGTVRFSADLPRATDAARALGAAGTVGIQQDLHYWIEAGDARSPRFKLSVYQRPTIVVQRIHYRYPDYTREPPATVDNVGDIRGLEGTTVTIEALANQPIKSAYVDFDADGSSDKRMTVDGDRATVSFTLELRPDRRTPLHPSYALRFTNNDGRTNEDPVQHRIDVTPDYAPEVRITQPEQPEFSVRAGDMVLIDVEARDSDYALRMVRLVGRVGDREVVLADLLDGKEHAGLYKHRKPFVPADVQLKPGNVLEYWAEAADTRTPEPNVGISEHRRLRIVADDAPADSQPNNQGQGGGAGQQGENNEGDGGEQGQGGTAGGSGGESGGQNDSGEGQQQGGEGTAGGSGDSGQSQESDAAGGESQAGGSGGESAQQENGAGSGGSNQSQGDQQPNGENSAAGGSNSAPGGSNSAPGESASADGSPTNNDPNAQQTPAGDSGNSTDSAGANNAAQPGNPSEGASGGQPGDQRQGAAEERVSSAGEDDATAFDRIRQQMEQSQDADGSAGQSEGEQSAGEQSQDAAQQSGNRGSSPPNSPPGESASADGRPTQNPGNTGQLSPNENTPQTEGAQNANEGDPSQVPDTPAGPDGANNPTNGGAPTGDQPDQAGAPDATNKTPREQNDDGGDESESDMEGETPTADAAGRTESDARGEQNGDRAGEGAAGGGQQAENAGRGEAGSHEAAETGDNQSSEPGAGETGTEAGDEQLANGETGQSSGDQQGAGSQSRESDAGQPGGNPGASQGAGSEGESASADGSPETNDPTAGDSASQQGNSPNQQPGATGEQSTSGAQQANPNADASSGQPPADPSQQPGAAGQQPGEPASAGGPPSPSPESATDPSNPSQRGSSATPPQGGGIGGGGVDGDGVMREPGGDDPNLEYARKQTDLVLNRLDEQLAKHKVDPKLLKSLGWTEDELRQFVDRWKSLKAAAEAPGDQAADARDELDAALRSLGLRSTGPLQITGAATPDELHDLNEAHRARAPVEYADRVRAYIRGAAEE